MMSREGEVEGDAVLLSGAAERERREGASDA